MMNVTENARRYTFVLIILTSIIRIIIANYTGLGIGESYYFREALNLQLSYFDQPPMFFWLGGLSVKILGISALALRLPSIILFAATCWLLFLITRKFFNAASGFWAVFFFNLSFVFTVPVAVWFQPDAALMFFWLLSSWLIILIMDPGEQDLGTRKKSKVLWLWTLTGISLGMLTLSKYHVIFLVAGILLFVIANRKQHHWFLHPGPYLALLIAFVVALPVLIWNYNNNWASFVFQGSRATADPQGFTLHFDWFLRSLLGQSLLLLPWIWIALLWQLIKAFRLKSKNGIYSFIFWISVLPIVFFTIVTLWADLQLHFHWQAPGYMMLFILLGNSVYEWLRHSRYRKRMRKWVVISTVSTILIITILITHMTTGFWTFYGPKWLAAKAGGKLDPTMEGVDLNDLRDRFEKEGWLSRDSLFVAVPRWWLTGKVDWALRAQKEIVCFSQDPRNIAYFTDPRKLIGFNAFIVGREHAADVERDARDFFDEIKPLPEVDIVRNGVVEMKLQLYYCTNFHLPERPREELPLYRQLTGRPPF